MNLETIAEVEYAGVRIPIMSDGETYIAKVGPAMHDIGYNPLESMEARMKLLTAIDGFFPMATERFTLKERAAYHLTQFVQLFRASGGAGVPLNDDLELPIILKQFSDVRLLAFWYKPEAKAPYLGDCTAFFRKCVPDLFFVAEHN